MKYLKMSLLVLSLLVLAVIGCFQRYLTQKENTRRIIDGIQEMNQQIEKMNEENKVVQGILGLKCGYELYYPKGYWDEKVYYKCEYKRRLK